MLDLKTIVKVKREMIKYLLGDDFYNNLFLYQKLILFKCITKKEVELFTKLQNNLRIGEAYENKDSSNNRYT